MFTISSAPNHDYAGIRFYSTTWFSSISGDINHGAERNTSHWEK